MILDGKILKMVCAAWWAEHETPARTAALLLAGYVVLGNSTSPNHVSQASSGTLGW